jgi:hypothetical protein
VVYFGAQQACCPPRFAFAVASFSSCRSLCFSPCSRTLHGVFANFLYFGLFATSSILIPLVVALLDCAAVCNYHFALLRCCYSIEFLPADLFIDSQHFPQVHLYRFQLLDERTRFKPEAQVRARAKLSSIHVTFYSAALESQTNA